MPPDALTNFSALDWGIVAVYLCFSVVIGLFVRRYVTNMTDFVVAGRAISTWLGLATIIGTEMGLITVMYAAQMGYTGGFAAFHIPVIIALMVFIVGATGMGIVPLRKAGVLTIPEFYARRFGPKTRVFGALILVLAGVMNMGLFLKFGAVFLGEITGLKEPAHIKWIMTAMLGLVLAYTMLGGMLSVVLTDYVQFVMLSVGVFVATIFSIRHVGWGNLINTVSDLKGTGGFDPLRAESFGPSYILFMCFVGMAAVVTWQPNVARALAAKDTRTARRIFMGGSLGFLIRQLIPCLWGVCAFVFIMQNPEFKALFTGVAAKGSEAAMPFFLAHILPTGILGIIAAAMLAAFMSTHDSYLLSWSSVIVQDIIAPLSRGKVSQKARIRATRICILLIGVFLLVFGLWYDTKGQALWNYMAITGAVYFAGAFVVLLAGAYWKRASSAGAVAAMLAGAFSILALAPVREVVLKLAGKICAPAATESLTRIYTGPNITLTAAALALILMLVFSLLLPDKDRRPQPEEANT